jgi:serine protease AprX
MRETWLVTSLLVVVLLTASGAIPVTPVQAGITGEHKVDPRVLEDTAHGKIGQFLVILNEQADTAAAAAAVEQVGEKAQGRQVYWALRSSAFGTQSEIVAQLQALGANYRSYWIVNMIAVEGGRGVVEAMAAREEVRLIEADRPFTAQLGLLEEETDQAALGVTWNVGRMKANEIWAAGYTGRDIVYANADTGVEWDHPALKWQYRGWDGGQVNHDYNWWDAVHKRLAGSWFSSNVCGFDSQEPCDDNGHGTHTTGSGVGTDHGSNWIGMAPGARWIACRNMDRGVGRPSTYIECLQFFLAPTNLEGKNPNPDLAPHVVGNSYSCPEIEGCVSDSLKTAVENVRNAGIFMAVSAGNSGPGCSTIDAPPAIHAAVFTVGATDFQNNIAYFSSRGPVTVDGSNRRKPDLVAPGTGIWSSVRDGGYAPSSGTSMAAPHVAGAVTLLWSAFPGVRGNIFRTETALKQSAIPMTPPLDNLCGGDGSNSVPNNVYGHGILDVPAAFENLKQRGYILAPPHLPEFTFIPVVMHYSTTGE